MGNPVYKQGDVEVFARSRKYDRPESQREFYGARDDNAKLKIWAELPHSCDGWVIGGIDEIDTPISDLQAARAKIAAVQQ